MADDITRHLAGLSEEIVSENMVSWEQVIAKIEAMIEKKSSRYWTSKKLDFIRALGSTQEARLFRAGLSRVYLPISTSHKRGLQRGDHFLRLIWNEQNIPLIEDCKFGKKAFQSHKLNTFDDPLLLLLPHLKRLWYESKDKLQAEPANE